MKKFAGRMEYDTSEVVGLCPHDGHDRISAPWLVTALQLTALSVAFIDAGVYVIALCVHCGETDLLTPPPLS